MATILTSEFTSNQDIDYKVEINSTKTGSPLAHTFKVRDVVINYDAETDAATGQVIPSSCDVICWNEGGYFNNTFIPSLVQSQQQTYQIKVSKDTGSGYELYWFGWVLQDTNIEDEAAQPRVFKLTAVDGLSMLADKDYSYSNSDAFQTTPIHKLIIKALTANNLTSLVGASGDWLVTTCDWWEDSMTYSTTVDPCTLAFVDIRVWNIFSEYWERGYIDCLSVLQQICTTYGARIYQAEGSYRFEQYAEREGTTMREAAYRYDYTQNSITDSASKEKAVDTNTSLESARAEGNQDGFLPAIKRCEINYERLFLARNYGQFNYNQDSSTAQSVGYSEVVDDVGLNVLITYQGYASGNLSLTKKTRMSFYVVLTCENSGGTTYYWDGDFWTTVSSQLEIRTTPNRAVDGFYTALGNFNLVTTELPADGEIELRVYLNATEEKALTSQIWSSVTPTDESWTAAAEVSLEDGEFYDESEVFYSTTSNSAIGDDEVLQIGTTNVGDGELQTGKLWVKSSGTTGTISKATNWRKGNVGTYQRILNLAATTIQSYYHEPLKIYDGDLYYSESFAYRVNWDSKYYLPLNASFSCNQGIWSGRWWVINADTSGITAQDKLIKRRNLFSRGTANANESELPNGMIGGTEFTEGAGQFERVIDYELTPAIMVGGLSGYSLISALGTDSYIVPTKAMVIKTGGTTPYGSGNASIYFASETTNVIDSAQFLTAINNGYTMQFNSSDSTKFFENEDLLMSIGSDLAGDYELTIRVFYKVLNL